MKRMFTVKRQSGSRNWAYFAVATGEMIEGGFFSRNGAEEAAASMERECTNDAVEKAERAAGWDPNP